MAKKVPAINASSMADISFLLLIFFLITTSMDVSQGLARRLPQPVDPNQKVEDTNVNKRNLMAVSINSANQLMVQGQIMDVKQLREKAKEFILNADNASNLPELIEKNYGAPIGTILVTDKHVISVQNNVETLYQAYLDVQNELVAAYNEIREDCAKKYFHKSYAELDEDSQKLIQQYYPQKISEAEPKNYGGK